MTSQINPAHPIAGNPTTASVRANAAAAKAEIEALQANAPSYPAPITGYAMVAPGEYRVTGNPCIVIAGFNGAADGVSRAQSITAMTGIVSPLPPPGATWILADFDCKIVAAGANGTHEFNCAIPQGHNWAFATYEHTSIHPSGAWIGGGMFTAWVRCSNPAIPEITTLFDDTHPSASASQVQGFHIHGYRMPPI